MVFLDRLWPDFDRRDLWRAIELYASRDRRYGGAVPNPVEPPTRPTEPETARSTEPESTEPNLVVD